MPLFFFLSFLYFLSASFSNLSYFYISFIFFSDLDYCVVVHPSILGGSPFIIATALIGALEKKFGLKNVAEGEEEGSEFIWYYKIWLIIFLCIDRFFYFILFYFT